MKTGITERQKVVGRPRVRIVPDEIKRLRDQGLSFRAIARTTGFGYGTVRRAYLASASPSTAAAD